VQAIRIDYPELTGWLNWLAWLTIPLLFVQLIGGTIYGVVFGPSFGLQELFYIGWAVLVLGLLFILSSLIYFRKRGKPAEGRGVMSTTVLVESGPYAIVRHPQFLGMVLMLGAAIFVSQHWIFVSIGVPLIVSMFKWI
jgi:protein-S-isoprenylcysteine O-methyltransferase Ste14